MFKFRAKKLDSDEWFEGLLLKSSNEIYSINSGHIFARVIPESLSVTYTGLTDKNGKQIFASFEVDGKMSRGGDIVEISAYEYGKRNATIEFINAAFTIIINDADYSTKLNITSRNFRNYEIIGKQWEDK